MNIAEELARLTPDPALLAWGARVDEHLTQQAADAAQLKQILLQRDLKIQALTLELAHYRRIRYGVKSESLPPEQRALFEETWNMDLSAVEAEVEPLSTESGGAAAPAARPPRQGAGRQRLPEHLPRVEHRHEPDSCTCGQCGSALVKIGEDVSEQLDCEPARFVVHRHIRPQYACRACETVQAEPVPPAVIDGGLAAPGLLAWLIIGKYLEHLPLYRLEQAAARQGVPLSRSTLADWVGRTGVALQPLVDRLRERLLQQAILHADETPVAQLDPGRGKTLRAYLWAYRSNDLAGGPPLVVFDYQASRSGSHAQTFLEGWQGHLLVDDYAGYKALFAKEGVTELGCWAHSRRKFYELHAANQSPIAGHALQCIGELYAIEREAKTLDVSARQALRQHQARPKLDELHRWLLETRRTVATGSGTAKAIDYSLKRWEALTRYADSGQLPLDNNPVENAIRPIALGRKNWLFTGSERAGRRAAAIQSLLATAKLNGVEPHAWLKATLEKLPTWPNRRIDELLPIRQDPHSVSD